MTVGTVCVSGGVMRSCMNFGGSRQIGQSGMKKVYYEWLRCIACFMVIFNHLKGYRLFMDASGIKQICYIILSVLTKINVPVFFMVSGALLLEKQEDFRIVFKKRISRIGLVILLFEAGIYTECMLYARAQGTPFVFTMKRFFYGMLAGNLEETGAYWYLYAYLGFLFMLPFLRKIARQMSRQDFYILFALHFVLMSLLPILNLYLRITGGEEIALAKWFSVSLASYSPFFYPLAGYYLDHRVDIRLLSRKRWTALIAAVFMGLLLSCLCILGEEAAGENYLTLFDYLFAAAAFLFIKYTVTVRFPALSAGKCARGVCFAGSLTFGIYLLDHYFKLVLYQPYETSRTNRMPSLFISFGWCVVSMVLGGMVTWILKRVPGLKKLL